jgi:hypothetical protein
MRLRRIITALALVSALATAGVSLIKSEHVALTRPAADGGCTDSKGNTVPVGTTGIGSNGDLFQCQSWFGIGIWVDLGPADQIPGGGNPTHAPLQP